MVQFTCHTPMIYPSSAAVHHVMVHLLVTPMFIRVVQQSSKVTVHLLVTHQWFIHVVQQSTKSWSIYLSHTNWFLVVQSTQWWSIYLSVQAAVHKVMVHLLLTHQWFILVVQQSTKLMIHLLVYPSSTAVHTIMVHILVTHQWFFRVVPQSTQWWSIYLSHTNG